MTTIVNRDNIEEKIEQLNFVPNRNFIVISVNSYATESEIELVTDEQDDLSPWQYVIAAGKNSDYKPKNKILINIERLIKRIPNPQNKMEVMEVLDIKKLELNGETYGIIDDSCVLGEVVEPELKS